MLKPGTDTKNDCGHQQTSTVQFCLLVELKANKSDRLKCHILEYFKWLICCYITEMSEMKNM